MMSTKVGWVVGMSLFALGCGDGTEADRIGVGAQCTAGAECESPEGFELECLPDFTGGYCGLEGCGGDVDCPEGSACVTHDDGANYCFRVCVNKYPDCNYNRSPANEANCNGSGTVDFVDLPNDERKVCVPPSGS